MPVMTLIQAINHALHLEMERDKRVVVLGEDVGKAGGVFRTTAGLYEKFGPDRAIDTPLSEDGIMGTAIGMALYGMRPVPEIQFADFIYPAFDQIVNELAMYRHRSGGQFACPLVIRSPCGGGIKGGHCHSQSPEAHFVHTAGLKVVIPSSPYEAKGLLLASIRDDDPVLFLEPKRIYRAVRAEVPEDDYTIPLGKARVAKEGKDVSVFAYGAMLQTALEAAEKAQEEDLDLEVVDLQTLMPLDIETVEASVRKTGRAVVAHEAPRTCGYGAELSALIHERLLLCLEAPVQRVTGFDTPFPYVHEYTYMPDAGRILLGVRKTLEY
ncbi:MAG: alpha-ketoacid dehydrogenase subunit beta [Acidobacteriota bacterium]|nr:MAG: alpha-ketoacid dehydrogenase subunit beta [Acidobacteriota bacterium]